MTVPQSEELPRLGRYQVINKIAAGGMAEVFLAKAVGAMGFQRLVAVKLIHANFTRDQEFVKMFIDEARIAMHLHHRNIVQVFDLDRANDTYFIAMEFVHGVNLYDLYERIASKHRWIEPPMALYLIAEISKGLHFAHTRRGPDGRPLGIIHRDISPQNVLLSFEGEVKITDFGIATAAERLHQTAAGIVKGKYAYMAPERLQEKPTDGRVDVFSAGVLLYELLVGENPFAGTSAVDTIENVLNKKILAPSERGAPVSTQLDRICLKALARNPADRFANAQDLADAVTEYALELTHARKDMAAGDASLAQLLAELFPEKAKRPPVAAADPKSFSLPGVGGVSVATLDDPSDPLPPPQPQRSAPKPSRSNGRVAEMIRTLDDAHEKQISVVPDPAETDEPTVLRTMDDDRLPSPMVASRTPSSEFEDFTTREEMLFSDAELAAHPTIGVRTPMDDRSMPTPITPLSADDVDKTAPTELPSMMPPMRKPIVANIPAKAPVVSRPTDPSAHAPDDTEDSYARTLQSSSGLEATEDESSNLRPPSVIVPPIIVPQHLPAPQVPPSSISGSAPTVRPPGPQPSFSNRDQRISAMPMGGAVFSNQPSSYIGQAPAPYVSPSSSYPGSVSGSHDHQPLVVPAGSSPDLASQPSYPPQGRVAIPARTSTIIAALLLVIAALVVLAAVLVVRGREQPVRVAAVAVKVTSTPPGATVIIDGKQQKSATPYDGAMLAGEEHTIVVSLPGCTDPEPKKIRPSAEEGAAIVNFDLVCAEEKGSITVQASPPDAHVFVNDQDRGVGNVTVGELKLGQEIIVRVEANGYKTIEQKITLDRDAKDITMPIVLAKGKNPTTTQTPPQPIEKVPQGPRSRRVQLTTEYGAWANVYYNKKWLGTTPLIETLPVGTIQLHVVNETLKINKDVTITIPESGSDLIKLPLQ